MIPLVMFSNKSEWLLFRIYSTTSSGHSEYCLVTVSFSRAFAFLCHLCTAFYWNFYNRSTIKVWMDARRIEGYHSKGYFCWHQSQSADLCRNRKDHQVRRKDIVKQGKTSLSVCMSVCLSHTHSLTNVTLTPVVEYILNRSHSVLPKEWVSSSCTVSLNYDHFSLLSRYCQTWQWGKNSNTWVWNILPCHNL